MGYQANALSLVSGTIGGTPITNGKLRGEKITFTAGASQYSGSVNGNRIEGTVASSGRTVNWQATRAGL